MFPLEHLSYRDIVKFKVKRLPPGSSEPIRGVSHHMRTVLSALVVVLVVALTGLVTAPSTGAAPVASNLVPLSGVVTTIAPESVGLQLHAMNGRRYGATGQIHYLEFMTGQYSLAIGLAHHAVDGGRQTTSAMCQSTPGCVAAVNGDYFDMTRRGVPDPGDEVGAIIQHCVLLHTSEVAHQQADLIGQSVNEGLKWTSVIDANGVSVAISAINQELPMSYAKVRLPLTGTLLFTTPYALRVPSAPGRITLVFTSAVGSTSPTLINSTTQLVLSSFTSDPVKVTAGHVDVSVPSSSPLSNLHVGEVVSLTTTATSGCENVGGHPVLLDHGVVDTVAPADTYMTKPYARSVIGWTASGSTVLLVVDGRDGISGATAHQLVALLRALHVVTALDLDGGNSTTLYAERRVINRPSDGKERPVSTAILVVQNS